MFASSLPMLPPPPTSLLPSLTATAQPHQQTGTTPTHPRRNAKAQAPSAATPLALLALEERTITQRKLAIAMYGWSWLRPAGCAKTMLGRKEEEIEREEVERQLREVEVQERVQMEMEEGERRERLERQARGEDVAGEGERERERDLDDEVPDAEAEEDDEDEELEEEEDDDDEEGGLDLDDEIPDGEADMTGFTYDSRREPSELGEGETGITDEVEHSHLHSGGHRPHRLEQQTSLSPPAAAQRRLMAMRDYGPDEEAIASAMLDEDEMVGAMEAERDLDDEVADADMDGDEGWEHTDTELEESEMDISILQQGQPLAIAQGQGPGQGQGQTRRTASGMLVTPGTVDSSGSAGAGASAGEGRRSWLNGASARRNLFGRGNANLGGGSVFGITPPQQMQSDVGIEDSRRRSGRLGRRRGGGGRERENRDSLD